MAPPPDKTLPPCGMSARARQIAEAIAHGEYNVDLDELVTLLAPVVRPPEEPTPTRGRCRGHETRRLRKYTLH